jgi:hypothetical protein
MKKQPEQRTHPRFQVRTGVGAALGETKIGAIINISRGGLALSCFDCNGEDEKGLPGPPELSIVHEEGFLMKNIPCKIIGDCSSSQDFFGTSNVDQCHIQFGELTPEQKSKLENFLDNFTDKPIRSQ